MKSLPTWLCILSATSIALAVDPGKPMLRVPKMSTPPTIDGRLDPNEWAGASAVTAFSNYDFKDMYPEAMRTLWYIGYDDKKLYLAMHYCIPKGASLVADTKNPDDNDRENSVLFGDHVEVEVTPHSPERATQQGYGFYKLVANPVGIFADTWYYNGIAGSEQAWSSGCQLKCSSDRENWWLEIAWPLSSMNAAAGRGTIQKADGLQLIMHLVRSGFCSGYAYAGWTPDGWLSFDRFNTIILDPEAPVMQFVRKGDIVYGSLDTEIRMTGKDGQTAQVAIEISNPKAPKAFAAEKTITLTSNAPTVVRFQKENLDLSDDASAGRCSYKLSVMSGGKPVFRMNSPFIKHTDDFDRRTYQSYISSRPKGTYKSQFAYYPVNGKAHVYVDLDVLAEIPEAVRNAQFLRLTLADRDSGKYVFADTVPVTNLMVDSVFTIGDLDGQYTATLELLSKDKEAVSSRRYDFVRKHYPWEHNTIGKERVVVPPFCPLQIQDQTIRTRCAEFHVGDGGLLDRITVLGKELLRSPMRIEGAIDGKKVSWRGKAASITGGGGKTFPPEFDKHRFFVKDCPNIPFEKLADTKGYDAAVSASGEVGQLQTTLKGLMDYDGFYKITLDIAPKDRPVRVEELDIVLNLWDGAQDLAYMRDSVGGAVQLPDGDGVAWESKMLAAKPVGFKGTFIPALSLGDGTYSLQFRAASDQGWLLDDDVSCLVVDRSEGKPTLRLRIVNTPTVIKKPQSLTFALIPLPAKPAVPNWRHLVWSTNNYAHIAYGWRSYGTGGDNWYLPNDYEYQLLGECIHYPEKHPELDIHPAVKSNAARAKVGPVLMYSSTVAVGAPLPATETYGGQWYGNSAVRFGSNDPRVGQRKNLDGRFVWDKDEHFNEARPTSYDEDLVDNYMWYHKKLITLANTIDLRIPNVT